MRIYTLYHWSPSDRLDSIRAGGLRPYCTPTVASGSLPYICCAPDPVRAWQLSAGMEWVSEVEEWDLWQLRVGEHDELVIRPQFGPIVSEVGIRNPVPPDRLWYVGRRQA